MKITVNIAILLVIFFLVPMASATINVTAESVGQTWVTWSWDEGLDVTEIYVDGHKMCGFESTMPTFDMLDLSSCQPHNVSIFTSTDNGTNWVTTLCVSPTGGLGGELKPPVIPVETTNLYTPFILAPILCLAYLFRAVKSDEDAEQNEESNPILGDLVVSGVGVVISAMVVIWFVQGISSAPVVIESVSYTLSQSESDNVGDIQALLANVTTPEYKINPGGTGMFIRSSISSSEVTVSGSSVVIYTHDSVRQLYQDMGIALLYVLLGAVLGLMFAWSLLEMRRQIQERNYYDENDMESYGG